MTPIKQLVAVRRKAGLTREEFFDYHYQKHGALSTGPEPADTPMKYFQTHFIDAAYHADTSQDAANAHPVWAFSDDITELYFDSPEHLERVFKSRWVAEKVGPDGANFSDFSAVSPMFVKEEVISLVNNNEPQTEKPEENVFVAIYFVALQDQTAHFEPLIPDFVSSLQEHASNEVKRLTVNTPIKAGFDLGAYFRGESSHHCQSVLTITINGRQSVHAIRAAQEDFEAKHTSLLALPATWIGFGERAVVFDQTNDIKFDSSRQPFKAR
ncbi:uncharacterized protein N7503_011834 [Penicillium pulvis]|uniref:uncharacterized protein n=1 Tax=Penicillium pulvis TaxID=1562058 RepID=UPI002549A207|nr:uncharacterized protein N7503_011834 [Penicillium pulvis]KAJ5786622.1 hypothetical protein N7503_011834 [Penicillium pulvis]